MKPSPDIPAAAGASSGVRVLVVDDEPAMTALLTEYLRREHYTVAVAHDGATALELARTFSPEVVVLDLGLPEVDGLEVCQRLRTFTDCYVIIVTARTDEVDVLVGLSLGADDYLTKPVSPREVVARVKAVLRRPRQPRAEPDGIVRIGALTVDRYAREATVGDRPVELTATEFNLLATLAAAPRRVFSRALLIEAVWGTGWYGDERLVDVHIRNLRRKLGDDPTQPRFVRTVRGVGYRIGPGQ